MMVFVAARVVWQRVSCRAAGLCLCVAGLQNQPDGDAGDIVVLHLSVLLSGGVSRGTVQQHLRRLERQGCYWHLPRPG